MSNTLNVLIKSVLDYAYQQDPNFLYYIGRPNIEAQLQTALESVLPSDLSLASDKPDFEAILFAFVQKLQTDNVWKDILHTGTGQTLLRNIASGLAYLHFAVVRATHNSMLLEGSSKNAILAGMNFLGVRVRRRVPQRVKVRLTIPDHVGSITIPRFTQFKIADVDYFNRAAIVYSEYDLSKDIVLYQGTVFSQAGSAAGIPYETIDIGYENFAISNEDVYVLIEDEYWQRDRKLRPWMANKNEKIFFTKTLETGNVQVRFGNGIFGKIPPAETKIEITWVETLGLEAKTIPEGTNFSANLAVISSVLGITLEASYGGDDELDLDHYTSMGPHIRSTNGKGVARSDYKTLALEYPRVRDALFRGQAEIAPGKRNWMNVVEATILTDTAEPFTVTEWNEFVKFIQENSIFQLEIVRRDPIIIEIDVSATVFCVSTANLEEIQDILVADVLSYSLPRRGATGYSIFKSDISGILEGTLKSTEKDKFRFMNYSKQLEYSTDLTFTYSPGFDQSVLQPNMGIDAKGNIIADFLSYIKIKNVYLDMQYTPRRTYSGRTDIPVRV